jgi:D-sedoheptulose 7-phosphate isomerase
MVAVIGNGGSAATASHIACDLGKTILGHKAPRTIAQRFKVMAMTDNMPLVTAWANDENYDSVFAEQLRPWIGQGDIVIAISASGNSPNIIEGVRIARQLGAYTIGFLGFQGGKVADMVDLPIVVRSENYGYIEDLHMMFGHMVTAYIKKLLHAGTENGVVEKQHLFPATQEFHSQFAEEANTAAD